MTVAIPHSERSIEVRKMEFGFEQIHSMDWFRNNPLLTAFVTTLSATFPPGEQMFIDSVRAQKHLVSDPQLLDDIRKFTQQEAHHTNQHKIINRHLQTLGWDAQAIEHRVERAVEFLNNNRTPMERLAATVCLEHITAIVAEWTLSNPQVLEGLHPAVKHLMQWHAIEEIEHKSVAFDVYMAAGGTRSELFRMMKIIRVAFPMLTFARTFRLLLAARRLPRWKHFKEGWSYLFGTVGMFSCIKQPFNDFFNDDFHPEDHDNRGLVEEWKIKLDAYRAV